MVWGSPGPMLESLLPLCWSNCCVVPFAMADALPRFFVDPGGCRRERVAPKRAAPRDLGDGRAPLLVARRVPSRVSDRHKI